MTKNILYYFMFGNTDGGSDNSLYYHILNLNKQKYTPFILYRNKGTLVEKLNNYNISVIQHNFFASTFFTNSKKKTTNSSFPGSKKLIYFFRAIYEIFLLVKVILKHKIDIVHVNHNLSDGKPALIAAKLLSKKVIIHNRGLSSLTTIDLFLSRFVNKIICISEFTLTQYIKEGINAKKCEIIYNGVDIEKFSNNRQKKQKEWIIGSVGRLEKWKGNTIFLEAAKIVSEQRSDITFIIAGNGSTKKELEELTNKLEINKKIEFLGAIENVSELYQNMDIFVHTAIEPEPFGRVIIEAMASGLFVISTNIGGPKEIITDGIDGFLLEPGNPFILADKILYLINNFDKNKKISNEAVKTVKKRFNIVSTTRKIEKLYDVI